MRAVGLKQSTAPALGWEALVILPDGLLPPGVGVAENLDAGDQACEGDALPIGVRKRAAYGGHEAHNRRDGKGTQKGPRPFKHVFGTPHANSRRDNPISR